MNTLIIPAERYTRVAVGLHWLMALLILFNLSLG
jgi:cytochrome b561